MEREVSLEEISDGKLYGLNDLVKIGCNDCKGCFSCCQGMGSSIVLDPYDICWLTTGISKDFEEFLFHEIELKVVDGIILPNLKLVGTQERCSFLNKQGRCSIHAIRPGFCRLFPLGRLYENNGVQYFLQTKECKKENRTKTKIKKWLDIPNVKQNERFVVEWHYFIKDLQRMVKEATDESNIQKINRYVLSNFYQKPYDAQADFYEQFEIRLQKAKEDYRKLGVM